MEDKNTQDANPQPLPANSSIAHDKVLQPSESFIEEMKVAQPAPIQTHTNTQGTAQTPLQSTASLQQAPSTANSLYPEASMGIGLTRSVPVSERDDNGSHKPDTNAANKILVVRIVAGLLILLDVLNAYDWFLERHAGYTSWTSIIGIGISLLLAVGILSLNEAARTAYVFLSSVMLILGGVGILIFYSSIHNQPNATTPLTKTELEHSLKAAQSNTSFTPKQRQEIEQSLQRQINNMSGSPVELKLKQYLSSGLLVLVSVGPLIFFTRPSVKEVFG